MPRPFDWATCCDFARRFCRGTTYLLLDKPQAAM
jgi:hypothetical protein